MKVIVYIGHHKVGSTALQVFLSQNSHRLLTNGILYPWVEMRGAAHALGKAAGEGDRAEVLPVNIREPHSALAYKMMADRADRPVPSQFQTLPHPGQMFLGIRQQIAVLKPHTVILCSEAFSNFGAVDPNLISDLLDQFPQADLRLYCALRRPDEYVVSWHGQRIKVGEPVAPLMPAGASEYFDTIHFNFRLAVEAWLERVPEGAMRLRNYADVRAAGGSEIDFMRESGVELPEGMLPVEPANPSLPHAAFEIVRRAFAALPRRSAMPLARFILNQSERLGFPRNSDVELLGEAQRREMADRFVPIHGYLSQKAAVAQFFPDIAAMTECRPIPAQEAMRQSLDALSPDVLEDLASDTARDFILDLRRTWRPD